MYDERTLKALREEVPKVIEIPTRIADLAAMAAWDLWFGPRKAADYAEECPERETRWPGWETAANELREWANNLPTLYLDEDGYLGTSPPQTYDIDMDSDEDEEPFWVEAPHTIIAGHDVVACCFDKELAKAIS